MKSTSVSTEKRKREETIKRLVVSAVMLGVATTLELVSNFFPLELPFGGRITIVSMLPIVMVGYMYGVSQGLFTAFCFSIIQILLGMKTVSAFFLPGEEQMIIWKAFFVCFLDYILAYTVLGFSGVFKGKFKNKALGLSVSSIFALLLRYVVHIISGAIFFGAWAEWFFSQEGFYAVGEKILNVFSGASLCVVYSAFYNGLYMIPEIILTAICSSMVGAIIFRNKNQ
jgi:thiamine transporter